MLIEIYNETIIKQRINIQILSDILDFNINLIIISIKSKNGVAEPVYK